MIGSSSGTCGSSSPNGAYGCTKVAGHVQLGSLVCENRYQHPLRSWCAECGKWIHLCTYASSRTHHPTEEPVCNPIVIWGGLAFRKLVSKRKVRKNEWWLDSVGCVSVWQHNVCTIDEHIVLEPLGLAKDLCI